MVQETFQSSVENGQAVVESSYIWKGTEDKDLLKDKRKIHISRAGEDTIIDFDIRLKALGQDVVFGDTKEGTFALRLHPMMDAKAKTDTGRMLNSEGGKGKGIWGKKARWVAYSGDSKKKKLYRRGYGSPSNMRYPTTWHARDYGLLSANPFGLSYYLGKDHDGSKTIPAGKELRFKYRVILQCEDANAKKKSTNSTASLLNKTFKDGLS